MKFVEPIRDKKKIEDLKIYFKGTGNIRNYCMFVMGINVALRISDLLSIKWKNILNDDYSIKDFCYLVESKTNREKKQPLNSGAKDSIKLYIDSMNKKPDLNDYVFPSRQMENGKVKPLDRKMAWIIIKKACDGVGVKDRVGTHTLRKTFGYHAFKSGANIVEIQKALNHKNISSTERYIGITQDQIINIYNKNVL